MTERQVKIKRKPRSLYFDSPYGPAKTRHNSPKYSVILHNKTSSKIIIAIIAKTIIESDYSLSFSLL